MSKVLRCGDIVAGCGVEFAGDKDDELVQQLAAHARADHGVAEVDAETERAVRAAIKAA